MFCFLFFTFSKRNQIFGLSLRGYRLRSIRVSLLRASINRLHRTMVRCGFPGSLLIEPDGQVFLKEDEVYLSLEGTSRFLKFTGIGPVNEGSRILDFYLSKFDSAPTHVLDIGANIGEISLYFAQLSEVQYVRSIEPMPSNIAILSSNLRKNPGLAPKIELVTAAIANEEIVYMLEKRAESKIVEKNTNSPGVVRVKSISFEDAIHKVNSKVWDLIKIDIEGYERNLLGEILANLTYGRCWLIEFQSSSYVDTYLDFCLSVLMKGYRIIERHSEKDVSDNSEGELRNLLAESHDFFIICQT
jgi:FkbM family methyltransferase